MSDYHVFLEEMNNGIQVSKKKGRRQKDQKMIVYNERTEGLTKEQIIKKRKEEIEDSRLRDYELDDGMLVMIYKEEGFPKTYDEEDEFIVCGVVNKNMGEVYIRWFTNQGNCVKGYKHKQRGIIPVEVFCKSFKVFNKTALTGKQVRFLIYKYNCYITGEK